MLDYLNGDDLMLDEAYVDDGVRELLAPEYRDLSDEQLEAVLHESFGDVSLEDVEDIWNTLGQVAGAVLPVLGPVLGGVVGGPVGAAVGGALGGAAGKAVGAAAGKPGATKPAPPKSPAARSVRPPRTPTPAAAAQLLALLFRPEVLQALFAMALGPAGRRDVPVEGTPVPPAAFANLLSVLAGQAAREQSDVTDGGEDIPEYLLDGGGEVKCDVAVPEERAEALRDMLARADIVDAWEDEAAWWAPVEWWRDR